MTFLIEAAILSVIAIAAFMIGISAMRLFMEWMDKK